MNLTAYAERRTEDSFAGPAHVLALASAPSLRPSEVHVWPFGLHADESAFRMCQGLLNEQERARAGTFAFEKDRHHHVVAHGVLRHLLSLYSGVAAGAIDFEHSASGKPKMGPAGKVDAVRTPDGSELSFNLSHSHGRALIGVCRGRNIGIDLEMVRQELDVLSLAESCFFGEELARIRSAPEEQRTELFFRYWVAKEAVLKGEGIGLGYPLDRFEVRFRRADDSSCDIMSMDTSQLRDDWTVRVLRLGDGWPGAVAARGADWIVRVFRAGPEAPREMLP